jgi:hypothetical protein
LFAAGKLKLELQLVARSNIQEEVSSYYPLRARWYSRLFHPWFKLRRWLHLEKIRLPIAVGVGQVILSLLLPGFSLFVNGRKIVGAVFVAIYLVSLVCFVVWLGFPIGSAGYGLMISVHASSIVFLESCTLRDKYEFGIRFMLAMATLLGVWLFVYRPVVKFTEANWWMPMLVQGRVMVMKPVRFSGSVQRGDRLLYSIGGNETYHGHGGVWVQPGFGWGPVLAVAGDTIRFSTNAFFINGQEQPRLPHMPTTGEVLVPEKHWFIWPELDISGHGNVGEANISAIMLQMATVSQEQFIGKPFKRWLWRRQILS